MRQHGITLRNQIPLYLGYAGDLSVLDESLSKMTELLQVLQVQSDSIGLKIIVKKISH